ncbi:unnamed protein product [Heterobilharzia americana]|nr:unnamed protein product [Heterobilharzia americana]
MEFILAPLFSIVECPRLKIKKPNFITWPSPMVFFALILLSYFLITGGVIYDMIVGPPSMGRKLIPGVIRDQRKCRLICDDFPTTVSFYDGCI